MTRHFGLSHYQTAKIRYRVRAVALTLLALFMMLVVVIAFAHAREGDDHGNHGELKAWFDGLKSKRGLCCSFADGKTIEDVDWDTACDKPNCHYRVRLSGRWFDVPDDAVITEGNKFGPAVVWPISYSINGEDVPYDIRCFMPGAGT